MRRRRASAGRRERDWARGREREGEGGRTLRLARLPLRSRNPNEAEVALLSSEVERAASEGLGCGAAMCMAVGGSEGEPSLRSISCGVGGAVGEVMDGRPGGGPARGEWCGCVSRWCSWWWWWSLGCPQEVRERGAARWQQPPGSPHSAERKRGREGNEGDEGGWSLLERGQRRKRGRGTDPVARPWRERGASWRAREPSGGRWTEVGEGGMRERGRWWPVEGWGGCCSRWWWQWCSCPECQSRGGTARGWTRARRRRGDAATTALSSLPRRPPPQQHRHLQPCPPTLPPSLTRPSSSCPSPLSPLHPLDPPSLSPLPQLTSSSLNPLPRLARTQRRPPQGRPRPAHPGRPAQGPPPLSPTTRSPLIADPRTHPLARSSTASSSRPRRATTPSPSRA